MKTRTWLAWTIVLALSGCDARKSDVSKQVDQSAPTGGAVTVVTSPEPASTEAAPPMDGEFEDRRMAGKKQAHKGDSVGYGKDALDEQDFKANEKNREKTKAEGKGGQEGQGAEGPAAPTRSWFPETFLFQPLVVTDDHGAAVVPVKVPDRLTSWRVLALAHSRSGGQAGATTSFLGTLPTYVDPVVPPFLMAGDQVRVPIQVVNTTEGIVSGNIILTTTGVTLVSNGNHIVTVPGQGGVVETATLRADHPGEAALQARFGGTDAVLKTFDVKPTGRPVLETVSGTLAAPRQLDLVGAMAAAPDSDRVRLLVYPGALALLRSELRASPNRGGLAEDAYALLLAGKAPELLRTLGDEPDLEALRTMSLVTGQRAIRWGRTLDTNSATLLAQAALLHNENPVLRRLGQRAASTLAQGQRPDGTFGGETGWTLQRLMVVTADATRAVMADDSDTAAKQRAAGVAIRASGAFERNLARIDDGYTAAAILASGAVSGEPAAKLRALVVKGLKQRDDGAKVLVVPEGVVRADGLPPSEIEATALAVLALDGAEGEEGKVVPDLGAALLGGYRPEYGWGDGRANLACMQAVLRLFKDKVPDNVKITLTMDGKPLAEGTLDREHVKEVLPIEVAAPGLAGPHHFEIIAEPAVPGLGYALTLESWVPWEKETPHGLELALEIGKDARVGHPVDVTLQATAPAGLPLHVKQSLPAGVGVDTPSLDALVAAGTIERYNTSDGLVELYAPAQPPGKVFSARFRVIPTLAGTLHTSASLIEVQNDPRLAMHVPPTTWTVR